MKKQGRLVPSRPRPPAESWTAGHATRGRLGSIHHVSGREVDVGGLGGGANIQIRTY